MIIGAPSRWLSGGITRVRSRVESARLGTFDLWFEGDGETGRALSDRSDAFAVAMFDLAAAAGEALEVRGVTSPRLAWGIRETMRIHHAWWPHEIQLVDLEFERLEPPGPEEHGAAVGAGFSGGVDSFYTVWRQLPANEPLPGFQLTHLLAVNGFQHDVDLEEKGYFEAFRKAYSPFAEREGLRLLTLRTNLGVLRRAFMSPAFAVAPGQSAALVAAGIALGRLFQRYFVAGFIAYSEALETNSMHPLTDPLLSTEALHVVHHGGESNRFEKVSAIAGWKETWPLLRVCDHPTRPSIDVTTGAVNNCSRCTKCVRTMNELDVCGALSRYSSFPLPFAPRHVLAMRYDWPRWAADNLRLTWRHRRFEYTIPLLLALAGSWIRVPWRKLVARVARYRMRS